MPNQEHAGTAPEMGIVGDVDQQSVEGSGANPFMEDRDAVGVAQWIRQAREKA